MLVGRDTARPVARPGDLPLRDALPGPDLVDGMRAEVSETGSSSSPVHWGGVGARIVVVDNYDSFTYNLVQELGELGAEPVVFRNDAVDVSGIRDAGPDAVVISPGPGRPEGAGISIDVVRELAGELPILGVCLGHQCIAQAFGGRIVAAPTLMHGKTSDVYHDGAGVLEGLPSPFEATRYHSLVVERDGLPEVLEVTAATSDGVVMGLRHRDLGVEGVQFHPESVLTSLGPRLLANFMAAAARRTSPDGTRA
ncbi:MAG TPA: aminodeoxychorismate/anthranilate synthase component II [Acidimicrobiales bacterium]|nr:aminodeoxychorismate/anthranilate synthase component II [Acidimicrobiales bacterium]